MSDHVDRYRKSNLSPWMPLLQTDQEEFQQHMNVGAFHGPASVIQEVFIILESVSMNKSGMREGTQIKQLASWFQDVPFLLKVT